MLSIQEYIVLISTYDYLRTKSQEVMLKIAVLYKRSSEKRNGKYLMNIFRSSASKVTPYLSEKLTMDEGM